MTPTLVRERSLASRIWSHAIDAVFPPRCVSCRAFGRFVCDDCLAQMVRAEHPRCGVCWQPSADSRCQQCGDEQPAFTAVRSVYAFGGPARDLVHALKYSGVSAVAPLMGEEMADLLLRWRPMSRRSCRYQWRDLASDGAATTSQTFWRGRSAA